MANADNELCSVTLAHERIVVPAFQSTSTFMANAAYSWTQEERGLVKATPQAECGIGVRTTTNIYVCACRHSSRTTHLVFLPSSKLLAMRNEAYELHILLGLFLALAATVLLYVVLALPPR